MAGSVEDIVDDFLTAAATEAFVSVPERAAPTPGTLTAAASARFAGEGVAAAAAASLIESEEGVPSSGDVCRRSDDAE